MVELIKSWGKFRPNSIDLKYKENRTWPYLKKKIVQSIIIPVDF